MKSIYFPPGATQQNGSSGQLQLNSPTGPNSFSSGSCLSVYHLCRFWVLVLLLGVGLTHYAAAQGALTNGWTHTATIAPLGNADAWTFSATTGDSIVVRVGEISQTNAFTVRLRLQNPNAVQIATAQSAVSAEIVVTATNTGTFTVMVDDALGTATGMYRLTLVKAPGTIIVEPSDEGGPLTNGVAHLGNLPPGDLDVWNFTASSGENLVIKVGQITETNNLAAWVRLYGPDGALLGSGWDTYSAEVTVRATNSGTFSVVIANNPYYSDAASGTYLLTLAKTGSPIVVSSGDEGGPLTNGVAHRGNLLLGDLDLWNFNASSGENLVIKIGQVTETNNFAPWVRLFGPDGALVASSWNTASAEVTIRATNSGTFLVVIANYPYYSDLASGNYLLTLAKTGSLIVVSPADEGGPLTNGLANVGNLPLGDLDLWNFAATSGESLVIKVGQITQTNDLAPWIRLYGPDGVLVASSWDQTAAEVAIQATNSGEFLVIIGNYPYYTDAASGMYLLTLAKTGSPFAVSPGDDGGPLTNGVAHHGNLPVGDLDLWNFTATANETIVLRVGQSSETNNFAPWLRLYGPNGVLVGANSGIAAGEVTIRATNSGTFLVVIGNDPYYTDAASGTYVLALARTGSPIVVSPGDEGGVLNGAGTYSGTMPIGDLDLWEFTACLGDFIHVRADEITQTNSFAPWVRLYGPTGALLASSYGDTFGEVALRTTNGGKFLVVIANNEYYNNAGYGTYQLTANGLNAGLKLCIPLIAGTNATLAAIGGATNATYILYTHTNLSTPFAAWTPLWTNQFDQFGTFNRSNAFNKTEPQRYFRLLVP